MSWRLTLDGTDFNLHVWGRGPIVLLMHGWSGGGIQFTALRKALLAAGYSVAIFDAPAHGETPGRMANANLFARAIELVAQTLGPIHAIVGHSLGGTASALAHFRAVDVDALVLVAPMPSFEFAMERFQTVLGLSDELREAIAQHVERLAGISRPQLDLTRLLKTPAATLLLHDTSDRNIPVAESRDLIARLPHLQYHETRGLGHSRILLDSASVRRIVDFIAARPASTTAFTRSIHPLQQLEW